MCLLLPLLVPWTLETGSRIGGLISLGGYRSMTIPYSLRQTSWADCLILFLRPVSRRKKTMANSRFQNSYQVYLI